MANKYKLDIFPEMYTNPLTRVRENQGGQSQGLFSELLQPAPRSFLDSTVANLMGRGDPNAALRKEYQSATTPERIKILNRLATTPKQQLAVGKMQQNLDQQQARAKGLAFKSEVVNKAIAANKPEDVTLIQSLDPVQDREMLIQYFKTGTFSKPEDDIVVAGNHLYNKRTETWISGPKKGQKEKRKLLKVELGTGDNKRVRFIDDQTGEQIGEDIVAPDSKDKNSAATMNKIHEANFYLGKKIGPALELLTQSKKDGLLSFDTGGTDAYIKEFFPESNEYKLKNNYYQSLASKEAFNSLEDLRIQAMETGSKGSGLGQITQNEFRALKDVLNRLDQRATIDQQIESLQEIEQRYKNVLRLAAGESPIDILDWDSKYLVESGYLKHEGKVYHKPAYGERRVYNPDTDRFEILPPRK
jgi:hypothetical protein